MRQRLFGALLALVAAGVAVGTGAQTKAVQPAYPSKPIRFVVPFPPGGTPDLQARMLSELIALAREKPGVINYASGGAGGFSHISAELFKYLAKMKMTDIQYKGAAPKEFHDYLKVEYAKFGKLIKEASIAVNVGG